MTDSFTRNKSRKASLAPLSKTFRDDVFGKNTKHKNRQAYL